MPLPKTINGESIASFLSRVPKQKDPEKQALLDSLLEAVTSTPPKKCYYCDLDNFKSKTQYRGTYCLIIIKDCAIQIFRI